MEIQGASPAGTRSKKALVLFSGGQDSTTCLAWALRRYGAVETVGFDYGQRHAVELSCRARVLEGMRGLDSQFAARLGPDHLIDMRALGTVSDCAPTREKAIAFEKNGLPNTFVPARNLLFFTYAAAVAWRRDASVLVGGMCETDYSGYPDCRDNTIKSLQVSLSLGLDAPMVIETPLMWLDKAETWALAGELGGEALVELIRTQTHTCYMGEHDVLHDWGYGCGECPACRLRARGWEEYQKLRRQARAEK